MTLGLILKNKERKKVFNLHTEEGTINFSGRSCKNSATLNYISNGLQQCCIIVMEQLDLSAIKAAPHILKQ